MFCLQAGDQGIDLAPILYPDLKGHNELQSMEVSVEVTHTIERLTSSWQKSVLAGNAGTARAHATPCYCMLYGRTIHALSQNSSKVSS